MALKTVRIGSMENIHQYDDGEYDSAIETDHYIRSSQSPATGDDMVRLDDLGSVPVSAAWPIGSVFLSVVSTNPNTLLGFGTWSQIAQGQFLVGYKNGDADFDPVENTGGSKTHDHSSKTSSGPSATETVDNNADISTVTVASNSHTHDTDLDSINHLPPFYVIYVWKRTA